MLEGSTVTDSVDPVGCLASLGNPVARPQPWPVSLLDATSRP